MNQHRACVKERVAWRSGSCSLMTAALVVAQSGIAAVGDSGEKIVKSICIQCHRIEGKYAPRKAKKPGPQLSGKQVSAHRAGGMAPESRSQTLPRRLRFSPGAQEAALVSAGRSSEGGDRLSRDAEKSPHQIGRDETGHAGATGPGRKAVSGPWLSEPPFHASEDGKRVCGRDVKYIVSQDQ